MSVWTILGAYLDIRIRMYLNPPIWSDTYEFDQTKDAPLVNALQVPSISHSEYVRKVWGWETKLGSGERHKVRILVQQNFIHQPMDIRQAEQAA